MGRPSKVIATSLGLAGFSVAVLSGMFAGNPAAGVVWNGILAMIACHTVGILVGAAGEWIAEQQIERYKAEHPIPAAVPAEMVMEIDAESLPRG